MMTNISSLVEIALEKKLDAGMRDKTEIFSQIVEELNVPRPTVRRIARDLRNKYHDRIRVLQSEIPTYEKSL